MVVREVDCDSCAQTHTRNPGFPGKIFSFLGLDILVYRKYTLFELKYK